MVPEYQYPITCLESVGSLGVCDNWIDFKKQGQTRASFPKDLQPGKKDFKLGLLGDREQQWDKWKCMDERKQASTYTWIYKVQ